jgi:phasin
MRTPFEIPDQMRDMADKSVEQAKKALGEYLDATHQAVAKAEGSARSVRDGAAEVSRQALAFVEENVNASFDFAHRIVQARTVEEIAALQKEFLARQMAGLAEQGKSLGEMVGRAATDVMDKTKT